MEVVVPIIGQLLKSTLPALWSLIGKDWGKLKADTEYIQSELQLIRAIIQDNPSRGRATNNLQRVCIQQLTSLAYDIEDGIDRFRVANNSTRARTIATEIGELKVRSIETRERINSYLTMATPGPPDCDEEVPPAPTAHLAVGLKNAEKEIGGLLQSQSGKVKVIFVTGFGSLRQTTALVEQVLEGDLGRRFSPRAWVSAAGKDVEEVLTEILMQVKNECSTQKTKVKNESSPGLGQFILCWCWAHYIFVGFLLICRRVLLLLFGPRHGGESPTNRGVPPLHDGGNASIVVDQLKLCLTKKRCLVVIDDVDTEELNDIISSFSDTDGEDSRIIVMATFQSAGTHCRCGNSLQSGFSKDHSSEFLIGELAESGFEDVCRTLEESLQGVHISNNGSISGLALQQCLLYFCMFPRDRPVRRNALVRRWLAEGLVFVEPDDECCSPYDDTFKTLMDKNVIQPIQESNNGKVKRCQPHGMILEYISRKSVQKNFMTLFCGSIAQRRCSPAMRNPARRLSLHPADGRLDFPEEYLSLLRTLAVFPTADVGDYGAILSSTKKYKLLRVLDLKECAHLDEKHMKAICDLLLLKYLSFGGSIAEVPRKIANLQFLETLDLGGTGIVMVHSAVIQLPKLKHLLGKFQLSRYGVMFKKKELQKFLSERSVLETLAGFVTGKSTGFAELMSHMMSLRKVKVSCKSTADKANLDHLKEGIKVFISNGNRLADVDYSLSIDFQECQIPFLDSLQAPGRLNSLKLRGELRGFPPFIIKLNSIEELCLSCTTLNGEVIIAGLSNLGTLKYLKVIEDKLGPLEIRPEHLPRLERICLVGVQSLHSITIQAGALPRLVSLHVICQDMDLLPKIQIGSFPKLKEVALHSEAAQEVRDEWQAAAMGHRNRPNVLFIESP